MSDKKRVCIFVDGENLRHSIVGLFPYPTFDAKSYLPKTDWTAFFDWIMKEAMGSTDSERVRTYWYVLQGVDFAPENLKEICKSKPLLEKLLRKSHPFTERYSLATTDAGQDSILHEFAEELRGNRGDMRNRFDGWTYIQNQIAQASVSVEFRRAGSIRYDLITRELGTEKAVDVKLATDLIKLKDIYDTAIVLSGDQDYVPAIDSIKDFGKHTINVSFRKEDGVLLPNGARRLNQSTDQNIVLNHADIKKFLFPA